MTASQSRTLSFHADDEECSVAGSHLAMLIAESRLTSYRYQVPIYLLLVDILQYWLSYYYVVGTFYVQHPQNSLSVVRGTAI